MPALTSSNVRKNEKFDENELVKRCVALLIELTANVSQGSVSRPQRRKRRTSFFFFHDLMPAQRGLVPGRYFSAARSPLGIEAVVGALSTPEGFLILSLVLRDGTSGVTCCLNSSLGVAACTCAGQSKPEGLF